MTWLKVIIKFYQFLYRVILVITISLYLIIGLKCLLYYGNNHIDITQYIIQSDKISDSFSGYRIVQLSDLHSKTFGSNQVNLLKKVKHLQPDIIVFTGDLVDGRTKLEGPCFELMKGLVAIAPTYYIYGNHEAILLYDNEKQDFFKKLDEIGVITMNNKVITLKSTQDDVINLVGLPDPIAFSLPNKIFKYPIADRNKILLEQTIGTIKDKQAYTILLCHRPEYIQIYSEFPIDLALCGHTHGGQIRLPFLGGLFATGQGFFPKYDNGIFKYNQLTLLINRGLGGNSFPYRIFNNPEVSLIILKH